MFVTLGNFSIKKDFVKSFNYTEANRNCEIKDTNGETTKLICSFDEFCSFVDQFKEETTKVKTETKKRKTKKEK